jgi:hypothetical protein
MWVLQITSEQRAISVHLTEEAANKALMELEIPEYVLALDEDDEGNPTELKKREDVVSVVALTQELADDINSMISEDVWNY